VQNTMVLRQKGVCVLYTVSFGPNAVHGHFMRSCIYYITFLFVEDPSQLRDFSTISLLLGRCQGLF
jgi:hypothetical protein